MLSSVATRIGARPKATLLLTLAFVVIAAVVGGPIAGALEDSGGFNTEDSGSAQAIERIEAATGEQAAPGVVLLVETPDGVEDAATAERIDALGESLAQVDGITAVATPEDDRSQGLLSGDGSRALVTGTLGADADEGLVSDAAVERFGEEDGVTLGGGLIADTQVGDTIGEDLTRAEMIAFPILLSLLFFRGRAALLPLVVGITGRGLRSSGSGESPERPEAQDPGKPALLRDPPNPLQIDRHVLRLEVLHDSLVAALAADA